MKQKNYNIEILRVTAFIMVIVIHVSNYFCRAFGTISNGEYLYALILNSLARVSVPCFFMMSGALLLGRTESIEKNMERIYRFLFVLIFWSIVYYLFNTYYSHQATFNLRNFLKKPAEAHLWYLYVMIPVYLMLPFLQAMCRGMEEKTEKAFAIIATVWTVALHLMSYEKMSLYYDLPILGNRSYIYYLFMGYFITKHLDKIRLKCSSLFLIFLGSALANVVLTVVCSIPQNDHYERILEYGSPLVILSSLAFFAFVMRLGNGNVVLSDKMKQWINTCCSCSFGIYLIHILLLDNYKIHVKPSEYSVYIMIPLLVTAITVLSFVMVYGIRKFSVGRKIT